MKNMKCKIGLHEYKQIGQQIARGTISTFSGAPIRRRVEKCERCGKMKYSGLEIGINYNDYTLNWDWEGKCNFPLLWSSEKCREDVPVGNKYCEKHSKLKCSCGAQATHECCGFAGSFVCGAPLCDKQKCNSYHTH